MKPGGLGRVLKIVKGRPVERTQPSSQVKKNYRVGDSRSGLFDPVTRVTQGATPDTIRKELAGRARTAEKDDLAQNDPDRYPGISNREMQDRYNSLATNQDRIRGVRKLTPSRLTQNASRMDVEPDTSPESEGRGPSPLANLLSLLPRGKKLPPALLQQLKGFDPEKIQRIIKSIRASKGG